MTPRGAYALMHVTVFIWGFTAILGKSISIQALPLVWYRIWAVVLIMGGVLAVKGLGFRQARVWRLFGVGALVAFHWLLFYGCIKLAGVSVAVLCLSSLTFFTAIFEPIVFRRGLRLYELVLGGLVVVGVLLLLRFEANAAPLGWALGLGSALFSAAFGTFNGVLARTEGPERVTFFELLGAAVVTSLFFLVWPSSFVPPWDLSLNDGLLLALLVVVCTVLPWMWSLRVLKVLSPYTLAIAVALEPVYAMVLAVMLWPESERLSVRFYVGSAVLIALGPLNMLLRKRFDQPSRNLRLAATTDR
jgi:drug/metabolite transporter (DMT)-like permease